MFSFYDINELIRMAVSADYYVSEQEITCIIDISLLSELSFIHSHVRHVFTTNITYSNKRHLRMRNVYITKRLFLYVSTLY